MTVPPDIAAMVWRLRARVLYLHGSQKTEREIPLPRAWLRDNLEIRDDLDADTIATCLTRVGSGRMRYQVDGDGLVLIMEARAAISDVRLVFAYWAERVMPKGILNGEREARIRARLKEGYTVDRLQRAVDGALRDPFLCGDNDRGRKYLEIHTIFRDGSQVERLEALAAEPETEASIFRRVKA